MQPFHFSPTRHGFRSHFNSPPNSRDVRLGVCSAPVAMWPGVHQVTSTDQLTFRVPGHQRLPCIGLGAAGDHWACLAPSILKVLLRWDRNVLICCAKMSQYLHFPPISEDELQNGVAPEITNAIRRVTVLPLPRVQSIPASVKGNVSRRIRGVTGTPS